MGWITKLLNLYYNGCEIYPPCTDNGKKTQTEKCGWAHAENPDFLLWPWWLLVAMAGVREGDGEGTQVVVT